MGFFVAAGKPREAVHGVISNVDYLCDRDRIYQMGMRSRSKSKSMMNQAFFLTTTNIRLDSILPAARSSFYYV